MEVEMGFASALTGEGDVFNKAWEAFLFNVDRLTEAKSLPHDKLLQVLTAGLRYDGSGWNTSKASQALWDITGVALVRSNFQFYRDIWLFVLAMVGNIEVPNLDLSQEQAEAAFAVRAVLEEDSQPLRSRAQPDPGDDSEGEEDFQFGWEEPSVPLPRELNTLWQRALTGNHKIDVKRLLQEHPRFSWPAATRARKQLGRGWPREGGQVPEGGAAAGTERVESLWTPPTTPAPRSWATGMAVTGGDVLPDWK